MTKTVVNSWNEWDPLKHVIVGRADNCHIPPEEPALDAKVPEDSDMRGQWGRRPQETIDRANELLDRFAHWYVPRREGRYLRRNVVVALANMVQLRVLHAAHKHRRLVHQRLAVGLGIGIGLHSAHAACCERRQTKNKDER